MIRSKLEAGCGMRDEIFLSGPGYAVFLGRDAGCFEFKGEIEDYKNHLMTEKTPNNDRFTGDIQSTSPCSPGTRSTLRDVWLAWCVKGDQHLLFS